MGRSPFSNMVFTCGKVSRFHAADMGRHRRMAHCIICKPDSADLLDQGERTMVVNVLKIRTKTKQPMMIRLSRVCTAMVRYCTRILALMMLHLCEHSQSSPSIDIVNSPERALIADVLDISDLRDSTSFHGQDTVHLTFMDITCISGRIRENSMCLPMPVFICICVMAHMTMTSIKATSMIQSKSLMLLTRHTRQ